MPDSIPYFDTKLEVEADKVPTINLADCRHHVAAIAIMSWPFNRNENITKYSFVAARNLQFDVDFMGEIDLELKCPALICLRGARVVSRVGGKGKLPYKLVFPDGYLVHSNGRTVDTFPAPLPEDVTGLPSWFLSQPPTQPEPEPAPLSPQSPAQSQPAVSPPRARSAAAPGTVIQDRSISYDILRPESPDRPSHSPQRSSSVAPEPPVIKPKRLLHDAKELSGSIAGQRSEISSNLVLVKQPATDQTDPEAHRPKKRRRGKKKSQVEPARNPALDMVAGFHSALYGPFVALENMANKLGTKIGVIGLVRGTTLPKVTANGDWCVSVQLLDPSVSEATPFAINFFLPDTLKDCIPVVKAGDILMVTKVAVQNRVGAIRGVGYADSFQWAGYSISSNTHFHSVTRTFSDLDHCPFLKPSLEELQYASQLAEWWKALQELAKTKPEAAPTLMTAPLGRSLITLSEAQVDVFFNCIVEILFRSPPGDQAIEIYVTDYTVHRSFYMREVRNDPGASKQDNIRVYGKRVLKVVLWGRTQMEHAVELKVPGYYYIDNLRVKFDSKGNLEGTLGDDRRKISKLPKDDPLLEDLLRRKNEYMSRSPSPGPDKNLARGQDPNLHTQGDLLPPPAPAVPKARIGIQDDNSSVTRLKYQNIVRTPIRDVLGHAACPEVFRIRARVAAFEPYKLENFAVGFCTQCKTDFVGDEAACSACADVDKEHVAYEYRFRLCVEEEAGVSQDGFRATLILNVSGKDAELLLSGVPPHDFHHKPRDIQTLRSRLEPIFGNLETYQLDLAVGNSGKALVRGQYFDMLVHSFRSATKSEGALDNKRYRLWGTELLPSPSE